MPTSEVHGPLGLQLNIPPHIPETHPVAYNTSEDQLLTPGRARSQPIGESSQGPSYGRRTQSESSLTVPPPLSLLVPRSTSATDNVVGSIVSLSCPALLTMSYSLLSQAAEQSASAPSPVPTEIIPPDLTQEEIVVDIQRSGFKVRDFAYENSVPFEQRAPELFDPILAWHIYELMLENTNPQRSPLNGRHLRRLLDIGWVAEEADAHRWQKKDREALEKFDSRPHYPWKSLNLTKPRKDELVEVAATRFRWVNADQLAPQFVNRGISRLASVLRGTRAAASRYQKRLHANDTAAAEAEEDSRASPRLKKRRLSTAEEAAEASDSRPVPGSLAQHYPLELVNGKPPQQFPAGRPSDSPPRSVPSISTQGELTRSLQRHLSMTSVSSQPTDLACSDSRTTLAHE